MPRKRVKVTGIEGLNRTFRVLPKAVSNEMRDASKEIIEDIVSDARSRGRGVSPMYAKYVAPSIVSTRDRTPTLKVGGRRKLPGRNKRPKSDRQRVGNLIFGGEYGGRKRSSTMQFLPHLGTTGYAVWPAIRAGYDDAIEQWIDAINKATVDSARKAG